MTINNDFSRSVPESELEFDFARSGGPGGQNVNKVSSKVILHWSVADSSAFSEDEKRVLIERLASRINSYGKLVLLVDDERSQHRNRAVAIERLNALVSEALVPQKKRVPTKPSRRQKRLRVDEKRRQGQKKKDRKPPGGGWD